MLPADICLNKWCQVKLNSIYRLQRQDAYTPESAVKQLINMEGITTYSALCVRVWSAEEADALHTPKKELKTTCVGFTSYCSMNPTIQKMLETHFATACEYLVYVS